jgi:hypothetical protein
MPKRPATHDEDGQVRPFADFLIEQAKGKTHGELSDNLNELVRRVQETEKTGTLTLTIKVAPLKSNPEVLVVTDEIKLRLPEHDRDGSLFYSDEGNLVRDNPAQMAFDSLREVPAGVNPDTGEIDEKKQAEK